jgi:transposase
VPIAELARRFELDRKTVRRCLRDTAWRPYQRPAPAETVLTTHAEFLRTRAPKVRYSAQILFQELRQQGYRGSYETVKRFVRPLRTARLLAEGTVTRFEAPPGAQSQIDWGTATVRFHQQPRVLHVFVLTLGFSRRSFYQTCPNETLPQFLDAHERAFEHFGGHTREHLYDRPRTVCQGTEQGRIIRIRRFGRSPSTGASSRALPALPGADQREGRVRVKYFKGNFLPGREVVDDIHLHEQLLEWMTTIAESPRARSSPVSPSSKGWTPSTSATSPLSTRSSSRP